MIMAISARVSPAFKLLKLLFTLAPRNSYLQCPNNRCIILILYCQYISVDYIYLSIYLPTYLIDQGGGPNGTSTSLLQPRLQHSLQLTR